MNITAEVVRSLLSYEPSTGVFTWKIQRGRARAGDVAGCVARNKIGYAWVQIRLLGKLYSAHRLVNSRNQHMKSTNTSGITGVYWDERNKKWVAEVKVNSAKNHLGRFENIHDAAEAVLAFRKCTGFTEIHGAAKRLQEA